MIMHLTAAQAETIARLASELGGSVALHQVGEDDDVYVSHPGMLSEILVDAEGGTAGMDRHAQPGKPVPS